MSTRGLLSYYYCCCSRLKFHRNGYFRRSTAVVKNSRGLCRDHSRLGGKRKRKGHEGEVDEAVLTNWIDIVRTSCHFATAIWQSRGRKIVAPVFVFDSIGENLGAFKREPYNAARAVLLEITGDATGEMVGCACRV